MAQGMGYSGHEEAGPRFDLEEGLVAQFSAQSLQLSTPEEFASAAQSLLPKAGLSNN